MTDAEREWARAQFERCSPWLQAALDHTLGEYNLEHVWGFIESGKAQIWPTPNACMVSLIEDFPTGLRVLKGWLSGGDLNEILLTIPQIESWGKAAGCTKATIGGREGWARKLPGYSKQYSVIAKDLT